MMGDFGKGIKSFKQGMNEEANPPVTPPPAQIQQTPPVPPVAPQAPVHPAPVQQPGDHPQGPQA